MTEQTNRNLMQMPCFLQFKPKRLLGLKEIYFQKTKTTITVSDSMMILCKPG